MDKILLEFPIFSLNDDYLKAVSNILYSKIDQIKNIIDHKSKEASLFIKHYEHDQKRMRDSSLRLIKSKINDKSLER